MVAIVAVPAAARAQAPPSFNLAPAYSGVAGSLTASVAVGDFNQDGIPDLALGSSATLAPDNTISLLLGTGGGVYAPPVPLPFPAGSASLFLACADLNGDGLLDLVSTDYLNNLIQVLMATGPGTFAAPVSYAVDVSPKGIAIADFNGDGFLDLAVAAGTYSAGRVSVLLGTGTGTFLAAVSYAVGRTPVSVVAADFNGDGIKDLAAANSGSFNVSILLGTGTGTFGAAVNYAAGGTNDNPIRMVAADFNGDGSIDLAVTTNKISPPSGKLQVLLGAGNGTFLPRVAYDVGNGSKPRGLAVGDFNGDGVPDLAVVAQG